MAQALLTFDDEEKPAEQPAFSVGPNQRDLLVRTVIGEAADEPDEGKAGVAHVVLNRLKAGSFGKTMEDVLFAPKQFEPWNTRRDELLSIPENDPRYIQAAAVVDQALSGKAADPTRGATNFANPEIVQARGNTGAMGWIDQMSSNGSAVRIGRHVFGNPNSGAVVTPASATTQATGQPSTVDGAGAAQPAAPRPFFKPQTIPVRSGVDMEGISTGARGVFDALAKLNIPGLEVVSGYRDPQRNARVGGAKGSQHIHGNALDINIEKLSSEDKQKLIDAAISAGARGIGIYPGGRSLHLDVRENPAAWGANSASPYSGVSDPNAYPEWARAGVARLFGNELPAQVASARSSGGSASNPAPQRTALSYAVTRGRPDRADMPAKNASTVSTTKEAPAMPQMMPDYSNSNDAGIRAMIADEAGGMGVQRRGGLGGLGGFVIPGTGLVVSASEGGASPAGATATAGGRTIESMIPSAPSDPFALIGKGAAQNQEWAAQRQGRVALAQELVRIGVDPERAVGLTATAEGMKLALGEIERARVQASEREFMGRVGGIGRPAPVSGPTPVAPLAPSTTPSVPAAPAPVKPPATAGETAASDSEDLPTPADKRPTPTAKLDTGNKTLDLYINKRAQHVQEYEELTRILAGAPTKRTADAVENRMKAVEKQMGQIDKQIEQYSPTPAMKEYAFDMSQRPENARVPWAQYDPKAEREAAAGPKSEEITGLRKEIHGLASYKNVASAAPVYNSMLDAAPRDDRASDVNLIYGMAKLMDPGSVVRESEMTVAQAIATLPDQIKNTVQSQMTSRGRLSQDVREGIMREAFSRMTAYKSMYDQDAGQYRGIIGRRGMNEADVMPSFPDFKAYEPPRANPKPGSSSSTASQGGGDYRTVDPQYVRPDGSAPPVPGGPAIPRVNTKADFDKLKSGAEFISPDGKKRVKP